MSDATLPSPRSHAIPPADARSRSDSSSGEGEYDTSFDQSLASTTREQGDDDGRVDGKQKRKRTSPQDQATLEAEYKQNPKPNKAARAEIVEKVSLNEKEVQIWFQNRRQINRRKSRPLLQHEIVAFGLGGMASLSSETGSLVGSQTYELLASSQSDGTCNQEEPSNWKSDSLGAEDMGEVIKVPTSEPAQGFEAIDTHQLSTKPSLQRQVSSGISTSDHSSFSGLESVSKSFTSTPGYLSNRWNPINSSVSTPASSQTPAISTPTITQTQQPVSCPERISELPAPSPHIRLSMSLDGKAELITGSPSPPRPSSRPSPLSESIMPLKRMRNLQRSHSALPFTSKSPESLQISQFTPTLSSWRSRDARAWEFCCDADAQDELTTQAERESNGTAVAAISLLRSTSNTALRSNSNKRNAPSVKPDSKQQGKKPKLGRAQSSLARLQHPEKLQYHPSGKSKDGLVNSPSGDSDKENWIPSETAGNPRRRPLPSARSEQQSSRAILGDNKNVPTHAFGLGGNRNRKRKGQDTGSNIFEDEETGGEEVEKFMRGEVSPSKKGDLDCIQGLLSLSKGNWR